MTKKNKNEMSVFGVLCSKCGGSNIVMNTDTKELICLNCGEVTEPDLILNSEDFNVNDFPTITVTDKVSRNEDNIDILDENTKRLFDTITKLEEKVDKLATGSNADKVPTDPEKCIENTISDLEYKIKLHTQHIEECYGTISRMKNDIDNLISNDFKLNDDSKEVHSTISENIADIKTLRKDLGDLSVKTKDAIKDIKADCGKRIDKIEDIISDMYSELSSHKTSIKDFTEDINKIKAGLRCMYDNINSSLEGVCEGQNDIKERLGRIKKYLGGEVNDADLITTFGELKVGDKFKLSNDPVPYIKVRNVGDRYLAYNAVLFRCYAIQDDHPVIPIKSDK